MVISTYTTAIISGMSAFSAENYGTTVYIIYSSRMISDPIVLPSLTIALPSGTSVTSHYIPRISSWSPELSYELLVSTSASSAQPTETSILSRSSSVILVHPSGTISTSLTHFSSTPVLLLDSYSAPRTLTVSTYETSSLAFSRDSSTTTSVTPLDYSIIYLDFLVSSG